jgi:hypothetical protein
LGSRRQCHPQRVRQWPQAVVAVVEARRQHRQHCHLRRDRLGRRNTDLRAGQAFEDLFGGLSQRGIWIVHNRNGEGTLHARLAQIGHHILALARLRDADDYRVVEPWS